MVKHQSQISSNYTRAGELYLELHQNMPLTGILKNYNADKITKKHEQ